MARRLLLTYLTITALTLAIVVIPLPTPFRAVIGAVYRATLSGDLRTFQRLNAMQRYLTDALGDEHPLETVIERLAELVGATAGARPSE